MASEKVETLIVGAGQAGVAMSRHLSARGLPHLVLERHRIAERWRSERWDSLVANGPAWHDRFPDKSFDCAPDAFASAAEIAAYIEAYAREHKAPIRCGVEVSAVRRAERGFLLETSAGVIEAERVIAATGPFQQPLIPPLVPAEASVAQIHSAAYRHAGQLPRGAVLVIGAGSSGAQIADDLRKAGRQVYLSVGPHDRPPRRYRGKDFVWWLGALGLWDLTTPAPGAEHVTIAVSGAEGGHTVDFRRLAARGIALTGMAESFANGVMRFKGDLKANVARGDANYLGMLEAADAYIAREGLDFPLEPEARALAPDPAAFAEAPLALDLAAAGVTAIVWATGYALDFGWLKLDVFDEKGRPAHLRGVSKVPGFYFLGLSWLSRRASAFIWGVWRDAEYLAQQIAGA